jgi:NAD(P)H-dependent FMN reductase
MAGKPKILALAGSTRKESYNRKLLALAVEALKKTEAEITIIDLNDFPLPLMNEDVQNEQGVPEPAQKLKKIFAEHHGLLLACPEYNSSITPLLKNTIDWVSRKEGQEPPLMAYTGKICSLISASPGALGGLRGLVTVRSLLSNIGVLVLPEQLAVPKAHEVFTAEGVKDATLVPRLEKLTASLAQMTAKVHPA